MKKAIILTAILIWSVFFTAACKTANAADNKSVTENKEFQEVKINMDNLKDIYFAGGCFWGVEEYFSRIPGVYDVTSGYANGSSENPSYEDVCGGIGHAETIHVQYDPSIISLKTLTEQFFKITDPLSVNKQGNDRGVQYRTGVYYTDESDKDVIQAVFDAEQQKYDKKIAVELLPLENFYLAEEYHQDYLKKNPNGYCHIDFGSLAEVETEPRTNEIRVDPEKYSKPSDEGIRDLLF